MISYDLRGSRADDHFRSGSSNRTANICHPLLRANWVAARGRASERPETLRYLDTIPASDYSTRPPARLHARGNPPIVFWLSQRRFGIAALAHPESKKARRVGHLATRH